jgi:integrase
LEEINDYGIILEGANSMESNLAQVITLYENVQVDDGYKRNSSKLKKDGATRKMTPCNSKKGDPHEVYPLKNKDDIENMKQYFRGQMEKSETMEDKKIACRNLVMFTLGINLGLRFSDLLSLKWNDVFDNKNNFHEGIRRSEQKTGKFKTFFLNESCRNIILEYVNKFKITLDDKDKYIFRSREGNHKCIEVNTARKILKNAASNIGIIQNIGTHSCRKTFGYWFYTTHNQDIRALTQLQRLFAHSSTMVTLKYIGIEDDETKQFYDDLNL